MEASGPADLTIRPAVPSDSEAISAVNAETWLATYPNEGLGITAQVLRLHVEGETGEKIAERNARIRNRIEMSAKASSSSSVDFVAVLVGGRIVGYVSAHITDDGRRVVRALYVLPAFQGRGIGHLLLERSLAWHGDGCDVYLTVVRYNEHARQFYEQHGFVVTGEPARDGIGVITGVSVPELEMVRRGRPSAHHPAPA
jgi:GNAT superfamily N-acetyltransferase